MGHVVQAFAHKYLHPCFQSPPQSLLLLVYLCVFQGRVVPLFEDTHTETICHVFTPFTEVNTTNSVTHLGNRTTAS
jgi:hypothetical protein